MIGIERHTDRNRETDTGSVRRGERDKHTQTETDRQTQGV